MKPFFPALVIACLSGALAGCDRGNDAKPNAAPQPSPMSVKVTHPHRGEISRWIALPAEIRPLQQATLYAKTAGYLKSIAVDKGDHVKAGDVIAEIESPELLADVVKLKAELAVTEITLKRATDAQKKAPDLVVPQTVDDARAKFEIAQGNFRRNETLLSYMKIIAPFSGVVTRRWVDAGAFIPSATSGSVAQSAAVLTLMDFNSVRIEVAVPEPEVPFIKTDLPVKLNVDELPGRAFSGKVTRLAYALDDATKTMMTEIELANADQQLRPGMFATVKIAVQTKADALLIPADALVTEKTKTSVFKIADGKAKKVAVKVGFNDGASVEILEGAGVDEPLILVGKQTLNDGQAVQIVEGK